MRDDDMEENDSNQNSAQKSKATPEIRSSLEPADGKRKENQILVGQQEVTNEFKALIDILS